MNTMDLAGKAFGLIKKNIRSFIMIIVVISIWSFFTGGNTQFLSSWGLSNLFRQMTVVSFLAIGMVLVIVTGNIDLSVGSVMGFINAFAAILQVRTMPSILPQLFPGMPAETMALVSTFLTIIMCLGLGLAVGIFQGTLIAYAGIPAFVVTLGGMLMFRGAILWVTEGKMWMPIEKPLIYIGQGYQGKLVGIVLAVIVTGLILFFALWNRKQRKKYGFELKPLYVDLLKAGFFTLIVWVYVLYVANGYEGIQNPVLLLAILAVILSYVSTNTRFGRYCYALGGNKEATRLSGVNIKKNIFSVFVLMGVLSAVAGIVLTGYNAGANIQSGQSYELYAIAACVIGGTSLMGGEGTIFGAIVGAIIIESLGTGMTILNWPSHWTQIAKGAMLILAVWIDVIAKKKKV
jgi:D-xylose transport system permease protein